MWNHACPLVLLLTFLVSPSTQLCAPDCTLVDSGTKVKDPTDCTRYYVCVDVSGDGELNGTFGQQGHPLDPVASHIKGVLVPSDPVTCPDDQYFNPYHSVPRCDPIAGAPSDFCSDLCNPCEPHCTGVGELTPDPQKCYKFYVCLQNNVILEEECETPLLYFDYMTGMCQSDSTLCYSYCDPCVPHCTQDQERVPDPTNCHKFYLCTPPTMSSYLCPHNEVFNPATQECEAGAPCHQECQQEQRP